LACCSDQRPAVVGGAGVWASVTTLSIVKTNVEVLFMSPSE
jgi:hypothetical protein